MLDSRYLMILLCYIDQDVETPSWYQMVLLIVSETVVAAAASPFYCEHQEPSRRKLQHLTLFWRSQQGFSLQQGLEGAGKGVGVMYLDRSCPITTSNITSFNLYNTSIDPSGCYQPTIAAQVWLSSASAV